MILDVCYVFPLEKKKVASSSTFDAKPGPLVCVLVRYVYEDGFLEWTGITGLSPTYITNSGPAGASLKIQPRTCLHFLSCEAAGNLL